MIDKWKRAVNSNKVFGAVFTDSSKAFVWICHDLLIAKLNACGLSLPALKLIKDYFQNRKKRTTRGFSYSDGEGYYFRSSTRINTRTPFVQYVFILCDLFLEDENKYFANYADDTTPYFVCSTIAEVLENLSCVSKKLFSWFAKKSHESKQ